MCTVLAIKSAKASHSTSTKHNLNQRLAHNLITNSYVIRQCKGQKFFGKLCIDTELNTHKQIIGYYQNNKAYISRLKTFIK